ncbi:MAG: hypothetical protein KAU20_05755 [Nanoarchaeota archaeon]|nr:hypothetical protein [Nanoarchaeota archaeon]
MIEEKDEEDLSFWDKVNIDHMVDSAIEKDQERRLNKEEELKDETNNSS